ncbi:ABC transporter substrate-binding protein [Paenibacillus lignilyticus]|uniref:ABC transporter substrate-binding protein n=1 Tax=Paenibacillus lignilyticus TaxID=1172615 RepID=A0ABS5CCD7_9BACL|nr:ABC transporter substrate-binding protein [Paenibacillus lignilyticus]MBP3961849.1 ABC transporter substrate-binding protein [Paenibacillus lignilyticus]MBP3963480.1 ABC transporter substrate-binding protein [Paenibacillus lignilyticus]
MRKKQAKWFTAMALAILCSIFLSACSNNNGNGNSSSSSSGSGSASPSVSANESEATQEPLEEVTLKMVLLGDKPTDADEVYTELSKMAKKDINANIEVQNLSWGEWSQKYPLLFSSGEDFDLVYVADWTGYQGYAGKNAFLELTEDLLSKNAPITWEKTPKDAWEQAKVNGKVYAVPQAVQENASHSFMIRGDLREKHNIPTIKDMAGLEAYLLAVAQNEKGIIPFGFQLSTEMFIQKYFDKNPQAYTNGSDKSNSALSWNYFTKDGMVAQNLYANDTYKSFASAMSNWQKAGVLSKNALTQKETSAQLFQAGKSAVGALSLDQASNVVAGIKKTHPEWKPEVFMPNVAIVPARFTQNGVSINANSKNPERALMFLDLLKWNKEYFDLTWYGIKGKHWEPSGDDRFISLADAANYPPSGNDPWGWRGTFERWNVEQPDDVVAQLKGYRESFHEYPYGLSFVYSDANVKNENAAINNLAQQYMNPVSVGLADYDTAYAKFEKAANKAGLEKVLTDLQMQIDTFKKNNP